MKARIMYNFIPLICFIAGVVFALGIAYVVSIHVSNETIRIYKAGNIKTEVCDTEPLSTIQDK